MYQPKTGAACSCRPGVQRDNCSRCEGAGQVINFVAIRARRNTPKAEHTTTPWALRDLEIVSTVEFLVGPDVAEGEPGVPITVINLTGACGGKDGDPAFIVKAVNLHETLVEAIRIAGLRLTELNEPGSPLGAIRDGLYEAFKLAESEGAQ